MKKSKLNVLKIKKNNFNLKSGTITETRNGQLMNEMLNLLLTNCTFSLMGHSRFGYM